MCGIREVTEHQYTPKEVDTLKGIKMRHISACGFHTAVRREGGREGDREGGREGRQTPYPFTHSFTLPNHRPYQTKVCSGHGGKSIPSLPPSLPPSFSSREGKFGRLGHVSEKNVVTPRCVEAVQDRRVRQVGKEGGRERGEINVKKA